MGIQGSATCWSACNFQSSARQVYRGGTCPWQGSGQESSADQSYWSGTGQFSSFRNCIVLYLLACVQFSRFSPPRLQTRHLPVAGVWPGKFGRPILLERHWPDLIFQELCSIVLVGLRAISKVQPAKSTEAALALGRGLAMKVRPTNPIGAALASSHLSGIVKCERKLSSAA